MKNFQIYLAGAMSDISFDESEIWRLEAVDYFKNLECDYNIKTINPNDYYNFLIKIHETEKEIIRFDLHKVRTSNLILVNLKGKSIGTAMELQHAIDRGIPIIGFKEDEDILHPWLEYTCDRVFSNIGDCLEYIKNYYLD